MNRSLPACFLLAAAGALAGPRADFGVVFNGDVDLAFVVPDRAQAEALLRANVGALADTPVKTLVWKNVGRTRASGFGDR